MCPYMTNTSYCALFDTYQDGYEKSTYCLSSSHWANCANYNKATPEAKARYMQR